MNRIQILTTKGDATTNEIIDWLTFFNKDVAIDRINNKFDIINRYSNEESLIYSRKSRHLLDGAVFEPKSILNEQEFEDYLHLLSGNELKVILESYLKSNNKKLIGNRELLSENKLCQLEAAEKVGMVTPKTLVTNSKSELISFANSVGKIIVKPLHNAIFYNYKGVNFCTYTTRLDRTIINSLPDTFFPSIFQEEIEKKYEIRTFFFYNKCFSMCIFSQQSMQTSVDFRMYKMNNPNRVTPYKLKEKDNRLVNSFMEEMNLNTGSLDFILGQDDIIYFLEVNPEGQFGMVSKPCNYFIEEHISKFILDSM